MTNDSSVSRNATVISLGAELSSKRAELGYSVEYVRNTLMLSSQQIKCLENAQIDSFYNEKIFLKALKKYASFLAPETSLEAIDELIKAQSSSQVEREIDRYLNSDFISPNAIRTGHERYIFFSLIVLVIIAILVLISMFRGA